MRLGLIGNPENRRVRHFVEACCARRWPEPQIISWERLSHEPECLSEWIGQIDLLRVDSPGENEAVSTRFIHLGGGPRERVLEFGEVGFLSEYHRGFCGLLDVIARLPIPKMSDPAEIAVMFDKWESHLRFTEMSLRRPGSRLAPRSLAEFRATMGPGGRVFLKPLHGSSASGVCALRWGNKGEQLFAPIEINRSNSRVRLFNSLKVRTYDAYADIGEILGQLLPQGMIEEQWIAKAPIENGRIDLRVLVINGEARHRVVRQSHNPMTNLHLGNRRGDLEQVREVYGEQAVIDCLRLAEKAASCFPKTLYAGVDILLNRRGEALVGEVNAFGDLLPGLIDRDETSYEAIARVSERWLAI